MIAIDVEYGGFPVVAADEPRAVLYVAAGERLVLRQDGRYAAAVVDGTLEMRGYRLTTDVLEVRGVVYPAIRAAIERVTLTGLVERNPFIETIEDWRAGR